MKYKLVNNIITLTNVEVRFNKELWIAYKNEDITLLDVKRFNILDDEIGKLNKKACTMLVTLIAGALIGVEMYLNTLSVEAFNGLSAIDKLGNTFLGIFKGIAHWAIIISAFLELVKAVMKGGSNATEILGLIFKYGLIYSSIYLIPALFDLIRTSF